MGGYYCRLKALNLQASTLFLMTLNPYAAAGWYNPTNPHTINTQPWGTAVVSGPSIFGALPRVSSRQSLPTILSFHYVCLNPDVLNCMITGPTSIPQVEVATIESRSVFRRSTTGQIMAVLEWGPKCATVDICDHAVGRQPVSSWLKLSSDHSYRTMVINGKYFMWLERDDCTCLFSYGELTKGPLVRFYQAHGVINLELTTEAFHLGVLEPSIVAVVVFYSAKKID